MHRIDRTSRPGGRVISTLALALLLSAAGPAAAFASSTAPTASTGRPATAAVSPAVTATAVPPRPSHVTLRVVKHVEYSNGNGYLKIRLTWTEPAGVATRFKVLGLLRCINDNAAHDGKACIGPHQFIRASDLRVLGTYAGTARSATLTIHLIGEVTTNQLWGRSEFYGLLLGAYNAHGGSVLAIVRSSKVCFGCTY